MRPEDVLVAVPCRGTVNLHTVRALQWQRDHTPGLGPIGYAHGRLSAAATRNLIVTEFLLTDKQVLVMVDDDVVPQFPLTELAARTEGDYAVVAAGCPLFNPSVRPSPLFPAAMLYDHDAGRYKPVNYGEHQGLVECDAVGTGCVAVRRDVFALMPQPVFADRLSPLDGQQETTEDVVFCERVTALGFRVAVDLSLSADHLREVSLNHLLCWTHGSAAPVEGAVA